MAIADLLDEADLPAEREVELIFQMMMKI